ncbi:hypothetical protein CFN78_05355 [Amycolatopsis antarctica]|uniref:Elongation factor G-binding protein C-terminal treble-clef zinc-finger domain-containing protein n=1 Tax=Amycolatopsis antarctica TaxID=1854586 RepID=A0A263D7T8_9PSEU|nr:FBP domain-containing protein [Amycolatopsis antarctica]OZM74540.1 hypothetical protein CFN78_05355 [Amycolatopsis antarctica]
MLPLTENEIRGSFVNCSKGEAKGLTLPSPLDGADWPNLDFLAWRDRRAPERGYLVLRRDDELVGVALRATTPPRSRLRASMCSVCLTVHGAVDVALFSARRAGRAGKNGNTVGTYLCADLACSLYVRRLRRVEVPQGNESVTVDERIARLDANLHAFVGDVLATRS